MRLNKQLQDNEKDHSVSKDRLYRLEETLNQISYDLSALESARNLIANIPRLKPISEIVYLHNKGCDGSGPPTGAPAVSDIPLEAKILKILVDLKAQTSGDHPAPNWCTTHKGQ